MTTNLEGVVASAHDQQTSGETTVCEVDGVSTGTTKQGGRSDVTRDTNQRSTRSTEIDGGITDQTSEEGSRIGTSTTQESGCTKGCGTE